MRLTNDDLPNDGEHHPFNTSDTQMFSWLIILVIAILQHIFHDEYDVLDELCLRFIHHDLTHLVEKLFHQRFDLVEEDRVQSRSHFVAY